MKLLLASLLAFSTLAFAETPYSPEVDARFKAIETPTAVNLADGKILMGNSSGKAAAVTPSGAVAISDAGVVSMSESTSDGLYGLKVAKATFDFADGDLAVGAHGLGVSLPAKAIIIRSWIRIDTQLVDTGTCTVAISCEDANNIKTATDITGSAAGAMIEGESTGAASAFKSSIAAACEITATVADGGSCVPSAGKGSVFVMYVVHN
jgi:hypothetical protein